MVKKVLISIFSIMILLLLVSFSQNDEKPKLTIEMSNQKVQYIISDYSWGNLFNKEKQSVRDEYKLGSKLEGMKSFPGDYVNIHFTINPKKLNIIEHNQNNKGKLYTSFGEDEDGFAFQIDTIYGERIFEIKGYWENGQHFSYLIKVNIEKRS